MWALFHPSFVIQPWHVFVSVVLINVLCCGLVVFGNAVQPMMQRLGIFVVVGGGLTTVIVLAVMPREHASSAFVWRNWVNSTGWSSGTAFLTGKTVSPNFVLVSSLTTGIVLGMLNGCVLSCLLEI